MKEKFKNFLQNKKIIVMGGGTSGWTAALYILQNGLDHNLNYTVELVSSEQIGVIGVGEGTTPVYANDMIRTHCKITPDEFLRETKGSIKYGIKFSNWNFDNNYYYHMFSGSMCQPEKYALIQYAILNNIDISQEDFQRNIHGYLGLNTLETGSVAVEDILRYQYSYHFSSELLINLLKKKCKGFKNFSHVEGKIEKVSYDEQGFITTLHLDSDLDLNGDFFINCLGFKSQNVLSKEYFDIITWDEYILNNSAFAIQVKNEEDEQLDFYTTSHAQDYGWTWKIPQYEKTGYGYVFSDNFINDESILYDDIIKTFNIKEKNIIGSRLVKSKPYVNKKQIYKNCLSVGLSSGFVEPLEATSLHLVNSSLKYFCSISVNDTKSQFEFNKKMKEEWDNVFEFIVYHYQTKNPKNDYWKYYTNLKKSRKLQSLIFNTSFNEGMFRMENYHIISLGMHLNNKNLLSRFPNITPEMVNEKLINRDEYKCFCEQLKIKTSLTHKELIGKIISKEVTL